MQQTRQKYLGLEMEIVSIIQDDVVRTSMTVEDPYESEAWADPNKGFRN